MGKIAYSHQERIIWARLLELQDRFEVLELRLGIVPKSKRVQTNPTASDVVSAGGASPPAPALLVCASTGESMGVDADHLDG